MSDQHNPWAGPDGQKAIKVLEDAGLLHILWKWGKGMVHAFGDVAASEISIPHYRDAARVFLEKDLISVRAYREYGLDGPTELLWEICELGKFPQRFTVRFKDYDAALIAAVLAVGKEKP